MRRVIRNGVAVVAIGWLASGVLQRVADAPGVLLAGQRQPGGDAFASGLEVLQLRPNFYMIAGAGGNIAVQVGEDGVVVVDAGSAAKADAVVAAIKALWEKPIRYVINTSSDPDHVGG